MNNKVIVVTGGGQGIGREIALHFLKSNWIPVVWELDKEAGAALALELNHPDFLNIQTNKSHILYICTL